jgi:hypothetical protein
LKRNDGYEVPVLRHTWKNVQFSVQAVVIKQVPNTNVLCRSKSPLVIANNCTTSSPPVSSPHSRRRRSLRFFLHLKWNIGGGDAPVGARSLGRGLRWSWVYLLEKVGNRNQ